MSWFEINNLVIGCPRIAVYFVLSSFVTDQIVFIFLNQRNSSEVQGAKSYSSQGQGLSCHVEPVPPPGADPHSPVDLHPTVLPYLKQESSPLDCTLHGRGGSHTIESSFQPGSLSQLADQQERTDVRVGIKDEVQVSSPLDCTLPQRGGSYASESPFPPGSVSQLADQQRPNDVCVGIKDEVRYVKSTGGYVSLNYGGQHVRTGSHNLTDSDSVPESIWVRQQQRTLTTEVVSGYSSHNSSALSSQSYAGVFPFDSQTSGRWSRAKPEPLAVLETQEAHDPQRVPLLPCVHPQLGTVSAAPENCYDPPGPALQEDLVQQNERQSLVDPFPGGCLFRNGGGGPRIVDVFSISVESFDCGTLLRDSRTDDSGAVQQNIEGRGAKTSETGDSVTVQQNIDGTGEKTSETGDSVTVQGTDNTEGTTVDSVTMQQDNDSTEGKAVDSVTMQQDTDSTEDTTVDSVTMQQDNDNTEDKRSQTVERVTEQQDRDSTEGKAFEGVTNQDNTDCTEGKTADNDTEQQDAVNTEIKTDDSVTNQDNTDCTEGKTADNDTEQQDAVNTEIKTDDSVTNQDNTDCTEGKTADNDTEQQDAVNTEIKTDDSVTHRDNTDCTEGKTADSDTEQQDAVNTEIRTDDSATKQGNTYSTEGKTAERVTEQQDMDSTEDRTPQTVGSVTEQQDTDSTEDRTPQTVDSVTEQQDTDSTEDRTPQTVDSVTEQQDTDSTEDRTPQTVDSVTEQQDTDSTEDRTPQTVDSVTEQQDTDSTEDRTPQTVDSVTEQQDTDSTEDRTPQTVDSVTEQQDTDSTEDRTPQTVDSVTEQQDTDSTEDRTPQTVDSGTMQDTDGAEDKTQQTVDSAAVHSDMRQTSQSTECSEGHQKVSIDTDKLSSPSVFLNVDTQNARQTASADNALSVTKNCLHVHTGIKKRKKTSVRFSTGTKIEHNPVLPHVRFTESDTNNRQGTRFTDNGSSLTMHVDVDNSTEHNPPFNSPMLDSTREDARTLPSPPLVEDRLSHTVCGDTDQTGRTVLSLDSTPYCAVNIAAEDTVQCGKMALSTDYGSAPTQLTGRDTVQGKQLAPAEDCSLLCALEIVSNDLPREERPLPSHAAQVQCNEATGDTVQGKLLVPAQDCSLLCVLQTVSNDLHHDERPLPSHAAQVKCNEATGDTVQGKLLVPAQDCSLLCVLQTVSNDLHHDERPLPSHAAQVKCNEATGDTVQGKQLVPAKDCSLPCALEIVSNDLPREERPLPSHAAPVECNDASKVQDQSPTHVPLADSGGSSPRPAKTKQAKDDRNIFDVLLQLLQEGHLGSHSDTDVGGKHCCTTDYEQTVQMSLHSITQCWTGTSGKQCRSTEYDERKQLTPHCITECWPDASGKQGRPTDYNDTAQPSPHSISECWTDTSGKQRRPSDCDGRRQLSPLPHFQCWPDTSGKQCRPMPTDYNDTAQLSPNSISECWIHTSGKQCRPTDYGERKQLSPISHTHCCSHTGVFADTDGVSGEDGSVVDLDSTLEYPQESEEETELTTPHHSRQHAAYTLEYCQKSKEEVELTTTDHQRQQTVDTLQYPQEDEEDMTLTTLYHSRQHAVDTLEYPLEGEEEKKLTTPYNPRQHPVDSLEYPQESVEETTLTTPYNPRQHAVDTLEYPLEGEEETKLTTPYNPLQHAVDTVDCPRQNEEEVTLATPYHSRQHAVDTLGYPQESMKETKLTTPYHPRQHAVDTQTGQPADLALTGQTCTVTKQETGETTKQNTHTNNDTRRWENLHTAGGVVSHVARKLDNVAGDSHHQNTTDSSSTGPETATVQQLSSSSILPEQPHKSARDVNDTNNTSIYGMRSTVAHKSGRESPPEGACKTDSPWQWLEKTASISEKLLMKRAEQDVKDVQKQIFSARHEHSARTREEQDMDDCTSYSLDIPVATCPLLPLLGPEADENSRDADAPLSPTPKKAKRQADFKQQQKTTRRTRGSGISAGTDRRFLSKQKTLTSTSSHSSARESKAALANSTSSSVRNVSSTKFTKGTDAGNSRSTRERHAHVSHTHLKNVTSHKDDVMQTRHKGAGGQRQSTTSMEKCELRQGISLGKVRVKRFGHGDMQASKEIIAKERCYFKPLKTASQDDRRLSFDKTFAADKRRK